MSGFFRAVISYYIYILLSASGKNYIGYSTDPWKRLVEHNTVIHNTFTSKHRPWQLISVFLVGESEAEAIRVERFIKKQKSKTLISKLIDPSFIPAGELARLVRVPHVRD